MDKTYIVVELDYMNDCGVRGFGGTTGPFTKSEAEAQAAALTAKRHYGTTYRVVEITTKHWSD